VLIKTAIDLRGDAPDGLPSLERGETRDLSVLQERALLRIERAPVVVEQRGHPERVALHAQGPGDAQEDLLRLLVPNRSDLDGQGGVCGG
jgi:hypothetical protein